MVNIYKVILNGNSLWPNLRGDLKMEKKTNEIMIYEDKDGIPQINVKFVNEDIWLTQNQIAEIYKTTQQNISQHINTIYKDNELLADSTNKKFLLVQ